MSMPSNSGMVNCGYDIHYNDALSKQCVLTA